MKDKKFHTLQAKLTLLVGMIVMISLIFFFGNFHLEDVINREYATLIEQNYLMSRYTNALTKYGSDLQQYSNMLGDSKCEDEYIESSEELMQSARKIYEAFPDPYVENLIYLSENLSEQGMLILNKTKSGEVQEAQQEFERSQRVAVRESEHNVACIQQCDCFAGSSVFSQNPQYCAAYRTSDRNGKSGDAEYMGSASVAWDTER